MRLSLRNTAALMPIPLIVVRVQCQRVNMCPQDTAHPRDIGTQSINQMKAPQKRHPPTHTVAAVTGPAAARSARKSDCTAQVKGLWSSNQTRLVRALGAVVVKAGALPRRRRWLMGAGACLHRSPAHDSSGMCVGLDPGVRNAGCARVQGQ